MPKTARKRRDNDANVQTVSFSVEGEFLTKLARDRLLDDAPGSAWRIITAMHGEGVADAGLAILKGDKKFVGVNDLELVDEDPHTAKLHKERVAWLYAGRIQHNGKWCRPVAKVTSYGIRDLTNDRRIEVRKAGVGRGYYNREWHYCGSHEIAPLADRDGEHYNVIFEECGELPHWMTPALNFEEAIKQWKAAGRQLEERGHAQLYPERKRPAGVDPLTATFAEMESTLAEMRGELSLARMEAEIEDFEERIEYDRWRDDEERTSLFNDLTRDKTREELRVERIQRHDRLADLEEAEAAEDAMRQRLIASYREKILAQAGDDFLILAWGDESDEDTECNRAWGREPTKAGSVKVPRAPFLHWAFDRLRQYEHVKPPWELVSRGGMKMLGDNRYHTDWVIGAGFDPQDKRLYQGPIAEAAMHLAFIQQERFHAETGVHVLVDGEPAVGTIEHGKRNTECSDGAIVVLPNLHPDYLKATQYAAAVITEEGGQTAHLAQVGRERRLPIVRVPDAREKFAPGDTVAINTSRRTIEHL